LFQKSEISSENPKKKKICGVLNRRNEPCQRPGDCPFHQKKPKSKEATQKTQTTSAQNIEISSENPKGKKICGVLNHQNKQHCQRPGDFPHHREKESLTNPKKRKTPEVTENKENEKFSKIGKWNVTQFSL
jgi:hypothetical protein